MEIKKFDEFITESRLKTQGHIYDIASVFTDHNIEVKVKVGEDGILIDDHHVSWDNLEMLKQTYNR